jgi:hypothetical protein
MWSKRKNVVMWPRVLLIMHTDLEIDCFPDSCIAYRNEGFYVQKYAEIVCSIVHGR